MGSSLAPWWDSDSDVFDVYSQAAVKAAREGAQSVNLQHFEWARVGRFYVRLTVLRLTHRVDRTVSSWERRGRQRSLARKSRK